MKSCGHSYKRPTIVILRSTVVVTRNLKSVYRKDRNLPWIIIYNCRALCDRPQIHSILLKCKHIMTYPFFYLDFSSIVKTKIF